jgi:hypothetical protein
MTKLQEITSHKLRLKDKIKNKLKFNNKAKKKN